MHADSPKSLIKALQDPALYAHPVQRFELLETHISWVLLTGSFAYKIKKPVDFGFLDFTTLEQRQRYCNEELRLNRRLAPELYLEVVAITGSAQRPQFGGTGPVIEFAVKMRQFPQEALLSELARKGQLRSAHVDELAQQIAAFHERIVTAGPTTPFGSPERVHHWILENFEQIRPLLQDRTLLAELDGLEAWSEAERQRREQQIEGRKRDGFVRECHGDMHLGNMALIGGRITPFDCIEFNEYLRWIDVMSEAAFVVMDLRDRGHPAFAHRFLNRYLERTGDYQGTAVLRYYLVYRALVRAKVALLRLTQGGLSAEQMAAIRSEYRGYAHLARSYAADQCPALAITHGLSGSGKSTLADHLVAAFGAIQVRSDVERKRLFGYAAEADTKSSLHDGIYTQSANRLTYERLGELAAAVVDAGHPVIVDATFLKRWQRDRFRLLAARLGVPFVILDLRLPESLLREHILTRQAQAGDASEADLEVLTAQVQSQEPLGEDELAHALGIAPGMAEDLDGLDRAFRNKVRGGEGGA